MSEGGSEQATSSIAAATATGDAAATVPDDDHATKVQMTQVQMEEIEKEIRESQSLASDLLDISFLKQLYAKNEDGSNTFFLRGIDSLSKIYPKFRTVRGDGNCYYRSFLYQLSERLLQDKEEYQRILQYGTSFSVVCLCFILFFNSICAQNSNIHIVSFTCAIILLYYPKNQSRTRPNS